MAGDKPIKVAICTWATGLGGGVARMEAYYHRFFNPELIDSTIISIRQWKSEGYLQSDKIIQLDQDHRFAHLLSILPDFDVVMFQGSFDPLVCEAAKIVGAPVLLEVLHNIESGRLLPWVDRSICISDAVYNVQEDTSKAVRIYNGIEVEAFPYLEKKQHNENIVFLQAARRSKVKFNLDELDIASVVPHAVSRICGDLQSRESVRGVEFLGVTNDMVKQYHQADYFVLLSHAEPFGLVVLEAMACGTPVIVAPTGALPEIVEDGVDGFIVPELTKESVLETLKKAAEIRGSDVYGQMRESAREKVEKKFRIESCVRSYEELIVALCEENKHKEKVRLPCEGTPPHALVGDALYYFHEGEMEKVSERMRELSISSDQITEIYTLRTAHDLARYLAFRDEGAMYPKGLITYLFTSGDKTPECLELMIGELDFVIENRLFESFIESVFHNENLYLAVVQRLIELSETEKVHTCVVRFLETPSLSSELRDVLSSFVT